MPQLVEVRFKGNRKAFFEWGDPEPLREREAVVVESERGLDLGVVASTGAIARTKCDRCLGCSVGDDQGESRRKEPEPVRKVKRRATPQDRRALDELRGQEDDIRRAVRERAAHHGLTMKISDAEWQWDRNKLTVYFTADKRVDFRTLVRDLATSYRTRIELRQIGVRDEAARLGGIGRCGRELCSASWLPELRPIGLHIAKDQRLSLNPSQISGPCGRLLCCLRYEHDFYVQSRKRFPKEGKVLRTARGAGKVHSLDIFRDRVTLRGEDGSFRTTELADLKAELETAGPQPAVQREAAPRSEPAPGRGRREAAPAAPASATGRPVEPAAKPPAGDDQAAGTRRRRRRRRRKPPGK